MASQSIPEGFVVIDHPFLPKFSTKMTENGSHLYIDEWKRLFGDPEYLPSIRQIAFAGGLRSSRFRSICWKISLTCLPLNLNDWEKATREKRHQFELIKNELMINPNAGSVEVQKDPNIENPLSQDQESVWRQFHEDEELRLVITQDVIRTFPEIQYFHLPEVRDLLISILFCFARKNPTISYRQGMHELLAPIVFVLHSDQQSFLHASEIRCMDLVENPDKSLLPTVLDAKYLEHDAYAMFAELMNHMEPWYTIRDETPKRLSRIHTSLLCRFDNELYAHLTKLEISPQIYGIRWLRLLFGREFPIQDLLVIWDAVIIDNREFQLTEYIFIAMLLSIRNRLLCDDYAICLGHLMRFPSATDVHYIIDLALHLREPYKYERPVASSHQMGNNSIGTVGGRSEIHRAPVYQRKVSNRRPTEKENSSGVFSSISSMMSSLSRTFDGISTSNNSYSVNKSMPDLTKTATLPSSHISEKILDEVGIDASQTINKELRPLSSSTKPCETVITEQKQDEEEKVVPKRRIRPNSLSTKSKLLDPLQVELEELISMRKYCADNMTLHIDHIQECISKQNVENGDEIMVSLAFLKRIRDILKGTLNFKQASEDNPNTEAPHQQH